LRVLLAELLSCTVMMRTAACCSGILVRTCMLVLALLQCFQQVWTCKLAIHCSCFMCFSNVVDQQAA
jgi:hypothetical protein